MAIATTRNAYTHSWPLRLRAAKPAAHRSIQTIAQLGLGRIGQLLTSLAADQSATINRIVGIVNASAKSEQTRDLDGRAAADTLVSLTALFGWGRLFRDALEVSGIRSVTPADMCAARAAGAAIKPIVFAERDAAGVRAFVAPTFLACEDPLGSLGDGLNGIRLDGPRVSNLFFSGPGSGPDDDAPVTVASACVPLFPSSPTTSWLLRVTFPGVVPAPSAAVERVRAVGLPVEQVIDYAAENSRWLLVGPQRRRSVDEAMTRLSTAHRIDACAFRRL